MTKLANFLLYKTRLIILILYQRFLKKFKLARTLTVQTRFMMKAIEILSKITMDTETNQTKYWIKLF